MSIKSIIISFSFLFLTSCGHPQDAELQSESRLTDKKLLAAHELLYAGEEAGECTITTSKFWNGLYHGLSLELTDGEEKTRLDFKTSGHITSSVKVKNFWFSSKVKEVRFQKVDIHKVPLARKDVVTVSFAKSGEITQIRHQAYVNNQWNEIFDRTCK